MGFSWRRLFKKWAHGRSDKKQIWFFPVVFLCFWYFEGMSIWAAEMPDEKKSETTKQEAVIADMVILLDKSGSMNQNFSVSSNDMGLEDADGMPSKKDLAIEWAEDICALMVDSDFAVSVAFFDGECNTEGAELQAIDRKSCKNIVESFREQTFRGFTNQYKAIEEAEKIFSDKKKNKKFIIMISDGELDLDGESTVETDAEKDQKACFRERCMGLAEEGYTIILIGLGQNIDLFDELACYENIYVYNDKKDLEEIKKILFQNMGITYGSLSVNDYTFVIEQEYEKCVIRLEHEKGSRKEESEARQGDYHIFYTVQGEETDTKGEEKVIEEELALSNAIYLYLEKPELGNYTIEWPYGSVQVDYMEKRFIKDVKLVLKEDDEEKYEKKIKNGNICYYMDAKRWNGNTVNAAVEIDCKPPAGAEIKCYLKEIADIDAISEDDLYPEKGGNEISINMSSFLYSAQMWTFSIKMEAGKSYSCIAVVDTKLQGEIRSNIVLFCTPSVLIGSESNYYGKANQVIKAEDYIENYDFGAGVSLIYYRKGTGEGQDRQVLVESGEKREENEKIQVDNNLGICFLEQGEYIIEVRNSNYYPKVQKICFHIKYEDPVPDIIRGLVFFPVIVLLVIAIIIFLRVKKRR